LQLLQEDKPAQIGNILKEESFTRNFSGA